MLAPSASAVRTAVGSFCSTAACSGVAANVRGIPARLSLTITRLEPRMQTLIFRFHVFSFSVLL